MADLADMVIPLLRGMRAENAAQHGQTLERFEAIGRRLDKIAGARLSFRHALTSKLVAGEFEERIQILERKVRELESQK